MKRMFLVVASLRLLAGVTPALGSCPSLFVRPEVWTMGPQSQDLVSLGVHVASLREIENWQRRIVELNAAYDLLVASNGTSAEHLSAGADLLAAIAGQLELNRQDPSRRASLYAQAAERYAAAGMGLSDLNSKCLLLTRAHFMFEKAGLYDRAIQIELTRNQIDPTYLRYTVAKQEGR